MVTSTHTTDLTNKCSDTTSENTLSTSDETQKQKLKSVLPTEQKRSEPNESLKSDGLQKLAEEYKPVELCKDFVTSDLKHWTLTYQGTVYTARHSPADIWIANFSEYADLDPEADWTDMEERADFLTQFWTFCAIEQINFPLTEKLNVA